jgi:HD-like signal output (HDOD) protein/FixJ family two-component response regulator
MDFTQRTALVVDSDGAWQDQVASWLGTRGYQAVAAHGAQDVPAALSQALDVVILELELSGFPGAMVLSALAKERPDLPVIVTSTQPSVEHAVLALRAGAADFLAAPYCNDQLVAALDRAKLKAEAATASPAAQAAPAAAGAQAVAAGERRAAVAGPRGGARVYSSRGRGRSPVAQPAPVKQVWAPRERNNAPSHLAAVPSPEQKRGKQPMTIDMLVAKLHVLVRKGRADLPVADERLLKLQELMDEPHVALPAVLELLGNDPLLTAKVLGKANGAFVRRTRNISTLKDACVVLGNKRVFAMAIEVLAVEPFACKEDPFRNLLAKSTKCSQATARAAAQLARRAGLEPGKMYSLGLLHNVGESTLLHLLARACRENDLHPSAEELGRVLEQHHEAFGLAVARAWKLPREVVALCGGHHGNRGGSGRIRAAILASWSIALQEGYTYLPGQVAPDPIEYLTELGIRDVDDVRDLAAKAAKQG